MAGSPSTSIRLRAVTVAYLDDLAATGAYGRGRSGVMRRFVEDGIIRAIERRVIEKKNAADFGEAVTDEVDDC